MPAVMMYSLKAKKRVPVENVTIVKKITKNNREISIQCGTHKVYGKICNIVGNKPAPGKPTATKATKAKPKATKAKPKAKPKAKK